MGRLLLLALLVAVGGLLLFSHREAAAAEKQLAVVAGELAGRPVRVKCQGMIGAALDVSSEAGSVGFDTGGKPSDTTELKRGVCKSLLEFGTVSAQASFLCVLKGEPCPAGILHAVWAVHTLAHESWHLAGVQDEAEAECRALQTTAWTAARLGATPPVAQAVAAYVLAHMLPAMPLEYQSASCHDGGPLDLRPGTRMWP